MKSIQRWLLLGLFIFGGLPLAQAEGVKNIRIEPTPDYVNIFWDGLTSDELGDADGYAVQFSNRQTDVKITKHANLFLSRGETSISLRRNSFENDSYYYLRVYSYARGDENQIIMGNGSSMIKWRTDYWNKVESQAIAISDPVVSTTSTTSSNVNKDDLFEFGELRKTVFDNFADFSWSAPTLMATSDFDGFLIKLSTKSDLSDPIIEETLSRDELRARIKGLTPNTQYYVGAYFYDRVGGENKAFGNKSIKNFKTLAAIPRDGSTRAARNITKIEKKTHGRTINLGGSSSTSTSTTTTSTSTSTGTSSTTDINKASQADVRARIAAIKKQISSLQSDLRRWEAKLDGGTRTSVQTKTTTTTSSSRMSRLRALLEARRNKR